MTPDQAVILQQLINGLSLGMMYALLALGFTMVYGIIELINFANNGPFPALIPNERWAVFGSTVEITLKNVLLWASAIILMVILDYFVRRTWLGKAMRATAQDPEAARMMGIRIDVIILLTFFIGSALAGAAALIFGVYYGLTSYIVGYTAGLRAFT